MEDERDDGRTSYHIWPESEVPGGSKMGKDVGVDEGSPIDTELETEFLRFLEARGLLEHHADLTMFITLAPQVIQFIKLREKGYRALLGSLLKGDFHLTSWDGERHRVSDKSLFIPYESVALAPDDIVITRSPTKHGYYIRRKT